MESTPIDIKFANAPTTAFARMMAMESTSTKDPITHVHEQLNEVDKTAEERVNFFLYFTIPLFYLPTYKK